MKKSVYIFFIATGLIAISAAEYKSAGPPGCFAGEPPNNTNCTSCHTGASVNSGTASILFDLGGADTGYVPGATYNITVSVKKVGMQAAGFQFTALQSNDNTKTPGTITLSDPTRTQKVDPSNPHVQGCGLFNKVYVEHTFQGITSSSGESIWGFKWQAPQSYVGDINFYTAVLESDFSGDEFGDKVYTKKLTSKGKTTSVGMLGSQDESIHIFPNPVVTAFNIATANFSIKKVDIVNTQGVLVKSIKVSSVNRDSLKVDAEDLASGVYFVIIHGEEGKSVKKIIVQ